MGDEVTKGWAIELKGTAMDLSDLRSSLTPPFDPWIEDYSKGDINLVLLRSGTWLDLSSVSEVMESGRRLIEKINGAHLLEYDDAELISYGAILRFGEDGVEIPVPIEASLHVTLAMVRMRATATVANSPVPSEAIPSRMQDRLARAGGEDAMENLLTFLARADNWFDLFKAMEAIEAMLDDSERRVSELEPEWKRAKQTANRHRHAPSSKFPLPARPVTLEEARCISVRAARCVLTIS